MNVCGSAYENGAWSMACVLWQCTIHLYCCNVYVVLYLHVHDYNVKFVYMCSRIHCIVYCKFILLINNHSVSQHSFILPPSLSPSLVLSPPSLTPPSLLILSKTASTVGNSSGDVQRKSDINSRPESSYSWLHGWSKRLVLDTNCVHVHP